MSENGRQSKTGGLVIGGLFVAVVLGAVWYLTGGPEPTLPLATTQPVDLTPATQPAADPNAPPTLASDVFPEQGNRLVLPETQRRAFIQERLDQLGREQGHLRPLLEISDLSVDAADAISPLIRYAQTTRNEAWPVFVALGRIGVATPELKEFLLKNLDSTNERLVLVALMQMGTKGQFATQVLSERFKKLKEIRGHLAIEKMRNGGQTPRGETTLAGMGDPIRAGMLPNLIFEYSVTLLSVAPDSPLSEDALAEILQEGDPQSSHMEGSSPYAQFKQSQYKPTDNEQFWRGENIARVLVASFQSSRLRPRFISLMVAGTQADLSFEDRLGDTGARREREAREKKLAEQRRQWEEEERKRVAAGELPSVMPHEFSDLADITDSMGINSNRHELQLAEMKSRAMRHYAVISLFEAGLHTQTLNESEMKQLQIVHTTPTIGGESMKEVALDRSIDPWFLKISFSEPEPSLALTVMAIDPTPDGAYLPFLREMVKTSKSVRGRAMAAFAIGRLGEKGADAAVDLNESSRTDLSPEVRQTCAWAVERLGGKAVLEKSEALKQQVQVNAEGFQKQWDELWGPKTPPGQRDPSLLLRQGMSRRLLRAPMEFEGLAFAQFAQNSELLQLREQDLRFRERVAFRQFSPEVLGTLTRTNTVTGETETVEVKGKEFDDGTISFGTELKGQQAELVWYVHLDGRGVLIGGCNLSVENGTISVPMYSVAYRCTKPAEIRPLPWHIKPPAKQKAAINWFNMDQSTWTGTTTTPDGKSASLLFQVHPSGLRGQELARDFYGVMMMTHADQAKPLVYNVSGLCLDDDMIRINLSELADEKRKPVSTFIGSHLGEGRIQGVFNNQPETEATISWAYDPKGEVVAPLGEYFKKLKEEKNEAERVANRPVIPDWLKKGARFIGPADKTSVDGGYVDLTVTEVTVDGNLTLDMRVRLPGRLTIEQVQTSGTLLKGNPTVKFKRVGGAAPGIPSIAAVMKVGPASPESFTLDDRVNRFDSVLSAAAGDAKPSPLPTWQVLSGQYRFTSVSRNGKRKPGTSELNILIDCFEADGETFKGVFWEHVNGTRRAVVGTLNDKELVIRCGPRPNGQSEYDIVFTGRLNADGSSASGTYQMNPENDRHIPESWTLNLTPAEVPKAPADNQRRP